ncbi:MAG: SagB-type dehydrogenase domain protein [Fibrobacteres bacterium]|nr:SagB-type dehydrogenase domain protein [Fibrobacterota bacterium]
MASFTERYHELTKYNPNTIDKLGPVHWDHQPPAFKAISSKVKIDLLSRLQAVMDHLEEGAPVTESPEAGLENIAKLLFFTLGLTARLGDQGGGDYFLRAAPSAGGLYPTEMYVAARNQSGLPDGLYHYHSLKSALIPVWQGSFWGDLNHYFLGHPAVDASGLILIFTGLYGRSAWRYKERAYRRILLDTGHAVGNLLEVCRYSGLDHSLMGGFLDAGLEELLFLSPKEEFPLLGVAIGPRGTLPSFSGQYPGETPAEAIRHLAAAGSTGRELGDGEGEIPAGSRDAGIRDPGIRDSMQVQQNACERIRSEKNLRPPVHAPCGGPDFAMPADFNPLKTILSRRSCRKFSGAAISQGQMREMLAYAFRPSDASWCLASGQLEFHIVVLDVKGLEPGVYRLRTDTLELEPKRPGDFRSETNFMCLGQDLANECAFALVHTSDIARLAEAYGDRGYRYACMDAGQIGERINLWAVYAGLGSSGIGGYYDDQANELLDIPLSHGILYITLVGVPEQE